MTAISTRSTEADTIIRRYMLGAIAVGLLPCPLVDIAALSGIQLKMLHSLARLYGVDFSAQIGKSAITSLLGGRRPSFRIIELEQLGERHTRVWLDDRRHRHGGVRWRVHLCRRQGFRSTLRIRQYFFELRSREG